jgi:hypothetical protein
MIKTQKASIDMRLVLTLLLKLNFIMNTEENNTQFTQSSVSSSAHPLMILMKKYHNCGMELRKRRKVVTDIQDISVIDLQILTNERFLTDLTSLAVAIL